DMQASCRGSLFRKCPEVTRGIGRVNLEVTKRGRVDDDRCRRVPVRARYFGWITSSARSSTDGGMVSGDPPEPWARPLYPAACSQAPRYHTGTPSLRCRTPEREASHEPHIREHVMHDRARSGTYRTSRAAMTTAHLPSTLAPTTEPGR